MRCRGKSFLLYFCYLLVGSLRISTYVNAVDGCWASETKARSFSGVFRGVILSGLAARRSWQRLRRAHLSSLVCTRSYCVAPALSQHLEAHQDARRCPASHGAGLLQRPFLPSPRARGKVLHPRPLLLPVAPGSPLLLPPCRQPC